MYLALIILIVLLFAAGLSSLLYWDKGRRSLVLAMRSLWLHKMRAFLSVLGIIIGTGAVIALMAFGEGSMQEALDDIRKLGATNIIVRSVKPPENSATAGRSRVAIYGLTRPTTIASPSSSRAAPSRAWCRCAFSLRKCGVCIAMFTGRAVGTTAAYAEVNELPMALGRFLRPEDNDKSRQRRRPRLARGPGTVSLREPAGANVEARPIQYVVVGVLKNRMPSSATAADKRRRITTTTCTSR